MGSTLFLLVTFAIGLVAVVAWRWTRVMREVRRGLGQLGKGRRARQILFDSWGPPAKLISTFNEVVPEVQARIGRLEKDREELRVVLGSMAEAVVAVDSRRRLLFANASADSLFGLGGTASVGRLVPELIRSPQVQNAVEETLRLPLPHIYQGELLVPLRESVMRDVSRILSVRGTPLPGDPPSGAVLVFHDVTDLRRLERMRQDFVANASHELKTPLAAIKAYTETLLDWALQDESVNRRFLERIDEQADRLSQLILDMLSLARLDASQTFFEHGPLSLIPMLESCVERYQGLGETKNLLVTFETANRGDEILILADEEAIRQIFDNLIDNAIKYTPEGGKVLVKLVAELDGVSVEVADTGIGIPREELPRIFERFYRVDKARSRELGGTGLGLAIVKHLVSSIRGRISVSSRPGTGSQFVVSLPRCRAEDFPRHQDADGLAEEPEATSPR